MNDSRETSRPQYFPQEVIDEEFAQWWHELSADDTPRAGTDSERVLKQGFAAGMNAGFEIAIDREKEGFT